MRDFDNDIRNSLERLTDPAANPDADALWSDLVGRRRKRRARNGALAALPLLLVAVLAVGVLSAQGSDDARSDVAAGGANSSSASAPWTPPTVAPSPPDLPLVGHHAWRRLLPFYYSPSDNQRMYAVYQQHIADCMDDAGFAYTPLSISGVDGLDLVSPLDRNAAEALGYHQPADGLDTPVPASPSERDQLDDCANTAMEETFGATKDFSTAMDAALQQFDAAVTGWSDTAEGKAKLAEWSGCMAEAGYNYATPDEPRAIFEQRPILTDEERATRLADLDCDLEVGLTNARSEYEEAAARRWIEDNDSLVTDLTEMKDDYLETLGRLEGDRTAVTVEGTDSLSFEPFTMRYRTTEDTGTEFVWTLDYTSNDEWSMELVSTTSSATGYQVGATETFKDGKHTITFGPGEPGQVEELDEPLSPLQVLSRGPIRNFDTLYGQRAEPAVHEGRDGYQTTETIDCPHGNTDEVDWCGNPGGQVTLTTFYEFNGDGVPVLVHSYIGTTNPLVWRFEVLDYQRKN